jgi:glycosyltransferase involved in cell wall biosynthesis
MSSPNGPGGEREADVSATGRSSELGVYVVLPTYNERENIARLMAELLHLPVGLRVVVVDDASPDGTGVIADQLALEHLGRIEVLHRAGKLGLGTAYLAGFRRACELGAGGVLTMDADFSHSPHYIPTMLSRLESADLVIGSRYVPGGGAMDSPFSRRLLSRGANLIAHSLLGLRARDVTAGFRLYRRAVLDSIDRKAPFSSGYSFLIELLFMVEHGGWRVTEIPIQFRDRQEGQSKISRDEIVKALYTVLRLSARRLQLTLEAPSRAAASKR